jgi:hypothetical protein
MHQRDFAAIVDGESRRERLEPRYAIDPPQRLLAGRIDDVPI